MFNQNVLCATAGKNRQTISFFISCGYNQMLWSEVMHGWNEMRAATDVRIGDLITEIEQFRPGSLCWGLLREPSVVFV